MRAYRRRILGVPQEAALEARLLSNLRSAKREYDRAPSDQQEERWLLFMSALDTFKDWVLYGKSPQ
jgi:hypothetical protein